MILRSRLLLLKQSIRHVWNESWPLLLTKERLLWQIIDEEPPYILASFSNKLRGSLPPILAELLDEGSYLGAQLGPEIRNFPGVILEFTKAHRIWEFDGLVKG
jgi:hypothetical protein